MNASPPAIAHVVIRQKVAVAVHNVHEFHHALRHEMASEMLHFKHL
jgi:hypothetical protein